ncbi:hypothetical protein BSP109_00964 [Brevibacterium sp. Mu109]|uniref:Zn-ribbon domain-containing OB-fold protein n=1 Tax=Brevibacterium sp. Mu109 TaxID=1255669 RepID=UPI000C67C7C0|nr:Zn-ribbon domain-containing OB-fold protein [Brevibacterium sp. Mu109]SMX72934.1 hypothetical protein BSP109_00964 [Brevibacterium sp. Mu109]
MSDATTTSAAGAAARIGSELPAPTPPISAETAGFWKATTEGRLLFTRCDACSEPTWYPREFCPHCGTLDVTWEEASGRGEIHSFTVVRRGGLGAYAGGPPYVLAYVELVEGVRMMTNIVDVDEAELRIGLPVTVVFHETDGDAALPRFVPIRR